MGLRQVPAGGVDRNILYGENRNNHKTAMKKMCMLALAAMVSALPLKSVITVPFSAVDAYLTCNYLCVCWKLPNFVARQFCLFLPCIGRNGDVRWLTGRGAAALACGGFASWYSILYLMSGPDGTATGAGRWRRPQYPLWRKQK